MAVINTLICDQDKVELVRDQVAAILALELENQYSLAVEAALENARDYKVRLFIENERPYDAAGEKNNFPFVNVMLEAATPSAKNSRVDYQETTAVYGIYCYAVGNFYGGVSDDRLAGIKAWMLARLVRNILMAGEYTYLGLRKTVFSRNITKIESGKDAGMPDAAMAVSVIRITLEVVVNERSPQAAGVEMEPISFTCTSDTGEILIDI